MSVFLPDLNFNCFLLRVPLAPPHTAGIGRPSSWSRACCPERQVETRDPVYSGTFNRKIPKRNITDCLSLSEVLFVSDARVGFDSFRNCMAATVNSKTIVTVNPGEAISQGSLVT